MPEPLKIPMSSATGAQAENAFARCAELLRTGRPEASAALSRCVEHHPDHAAGWRLLGDTLMILKKFEAALVCFERSRRGAPTSEAALRVGTVLQALGRSKAARIAFADAAARDPASVRAHFLEGVAAQDSGDYAGAAEAYAQTLALDPNLGEAAFNLGTVRQELGDLEGARQAYASAARLRSDGFGRAAQALSAASQGELWLDLGALRRSLDALAG